MSANHHFLAKTTTDSVLEKFRTGNWSCCDDAGAGFYRVGCDSSFPSPDAAFFDDTKKILVSFEFKPPTETKRGILTGLGQSIAYLKSCNLSYLVIPSKIEDFRMGDYMADLYTKQIGDHLPVGLIVYDNDQPSEVELRHNVKSITDTRVFASFAASRFWAKHQDLPLPLFHLILHCYYLKKIGLVKDDAFAYCWKTFLVPPGVLSELRGVEVKDLSGTIIKTLSGRKNIIFLEKKLNKISELKGAEQQLAIEKLSRDIDTRISGDNYYNSIKKNFVTFIKHIGAIDSTGNLTEEGFKLYELGLSAGANSILFENYFLKTVLTSGHHLDLILDLDNLCNKYRGKKNLSEVISIMEEEYETKGMIKRNPRRIAGDESSVDFLKYETILWHSTNLMIQIKGKPEAAFNWKKITDICSLPDL